MPRRLDHADPLAHETAAERRRLADLYADLTPDQWSTPSLCAGWRVREVLAHVTMPYRHSSLRVLRGIAAARGDFNRFADRIAHEDTARLSDAELLTRRPRLDRGAVVDELPLVCGICAAPAVPLRRCRLRRHRARASGRTRTRCRA